MSNYYIQRKPTDTDPNPDVIDIEATFEGLYVNEIENLLGKGDVKNRYIETFADRAEYKIYDPPVGTSVLHESTNVNIVLTILGSTMVDSYISFVNYLLLREFTIWDELRKVKADLIVTAAISPDDIFITDQERIEVKIECLNIKGTFEKITN